MVILYIRIVQAKWLTAWLVLLSLFCAGNDTRNDSIVESSITLPQSLIERFSVIRYLQTFFATSVLLQLLPPSDANVSDYNFTVDSEVLGFTIPGEEITNTSEPVVIRFQSLRSRSGMVSLIYK